MTIYLIEELWVDTLENRDAYGYKTIGYVTSEDEAKKICNSKFINKSKYPWPLETAWEFNNIQEIPCFKYKEVKVLKGE